MDGTIRIGIVGDFNPAFHTHPPITEAIRHAAEKLSLRVQAQWVPTEAVSTTNVESVLGDYHGLWAASGSPYHSKEGTLAAIEFARTSNRPFLGT